LLHVYIDCRIISANVARRATNPWSLITITMHHYWYLITIIIYYCFNLNSQLLRTMQQTCSVFFPNISTEILNIYFRNK